MNAPRPARSAARAADASTRPGRTPVAAASSAPHEVRLIGGRLKRTPLPVLAWPGLRPTSGRVRETLFNWLGQDLSGWRVLDAFAGSGALGLEAASRGATDVVLLEREPRLARHLQAQVTRLKLDGVGVTAADALAWMARCALQHPAGRFDLVFVDPPFDADLFDAALQAAASCVPPEGWIYLEAPHPLGHGAAKPLPAGLRLHRHGQAGAVHYHLIQRVDSTPVAAAPDA
ncbi:MAG: 16S rRNA (guanine(966)-N(2))-methyltransferase RsmD [Rubrivivax sp.]|nr:MAG: 16S rRNA (guanine(966)-N(2))-methyltransferase RsmD [Rubrivivax sp.]